MATLLSTSNLKRAAAILWALLLVGLPITTFRYIPGPLGLAQIKPFSMLPLALLIPVLLWLHWRQRRLPLPINLRPLLVFLFFAAAASAIAILYAPEPLRGAGVEGRILRGWISLLIGLGFYIAAFWMNRSRADVHFTLRWLYVGLSILIVWSFVQAFAIHTGFVSTDWANAVQLAFSEHPLFPLRVSGLAYEPSWLADQLVGLYMPFLFAAVLLRSSLTRWRWLEPLLLVLALAVLLLTYSRGGLLVALVCAGFVLLLAGRSAFQRAWDWWRAPFVRAPSVRASSGRRRAAKGALRRPAADLALRLALLAAVLLAGAAAGSFLARYEYITSLWEPSANERDLVEYIVDISAGPRLAYALAGYQVFEYAPLTGVGLGASGLYLFPEFPDWSHTIPEIARQLSPDSDIIPNVKNLHMRLLAETGLPGFWFFSVFFVSFLALLRRMWIAKDGFYRFIAVAGVFAWVATLLRNFTQDSFTFPIMWVIFGLLAGVYPQQPETLKGLNE
ncbi:MAG: O-antigen ligase family protein [Anaerolineales bacterium]|nr:O-antigen ligase family protein [Anaerolineales bacterium]